jgi:hypothetical protein
LYSVSTCPSASLMRNLLIGINRIILKIGRVHYGFSAVAVKKQRVCPCHIGHGNDCRTCKRHRLKSQRVAPFKPYLGPFSRILPDRLCHLCYSASLRRPQDRPALHVSLAPHCSTFFSALPARVSCTLKKEHTDYKNPH